LHYMLEFNRCMYLYKVYKHRRRIEEQPIMRTQDMEPPAFDISRISLLLEDDVVLHLFELCKTAKNERRWRTMGKSVGALKEMFMTLEIMHHSGETIFMEKTMQIMQSVLYDPARTDQIIKLVKEYDPTKNSR